MEIHSNWDNVSPDYEQSFEAQRSEYYDQEARDSNKGQNWTTAAKIRAKRNKTSDESL